MKNFYEIGKSSINDQLIEISHNNGDWIKYFNFEVKFVPSAILLQDDILKNISNYFNFHGGILKLDPYVNYVWHTDTNRGLAINLLLEHGQSLCMFSKDDDPVVKKFELLDYKPKTYYAFNTQQLHSVINLDKTRYLFSVEFELKKDQLSYESFLKTIGELKLLHI